MRIFKRLINRLARPLGINPFPKAFENQLPPNIISPKNIFDEIYRRNYWGSSESRSGVGSELKFTNRYRDELLHTIRRYNIRTFFDAPCGDLNWITSTIKETHLIYEGGDVSEEVIKDAKQRHPDFDLRVFDITLDKFPDSDIWHCRDCFFHLPLNAISQSLENFTSSSIPYALITSHKSMFMHKNLDVGHGGFRFLDLERPPFSLPRPIMRIADYKKGFDFPRFVCLWTREQIAAAISRSKAMNGLSKIIQA